MKYIIAFPVMLLRYKKYSVLRLRVKVWANVFFPEKCIPLPTYYLSEYLLAFAVLLHTYTPRMRSCELAGHVMIACQSQSLS